MFTCANPYSLGLYEKAMPLSLSWEKKLSLAKEAGFDYIEISIDETDEKLARIEQNCLERAEIHDAIKRIGLPIYSMCLSGHRRYPLGDPDPQKALRALEIMQKAIDFSVEFGIRIIQIAGYDVYYDKSTGKTAELFEKNLRLALHMASKRGVVLGFETMETRFMDNIEKAMRYVRKIKSPYLGVYPDSGNCTNAAKLYGASVIADFRKGEGHILAVHLKESAHGRYRDVPYGNGHVDFDEIIRVSWAMGVRMFVTEFWASGDNWKEELFRSHRFSTEKLKRYC
jgi:predicted hexulose-6-phosphate isomerase